MGELDQEIIVGILGQWASGKSTAADTLIGYLGGRDEVSFINDRELLARQAVNYLLGLDDSKIVRNIEDDGRQRIEGDLAIVYLGPGDDLETINLSTLLFDLHDDIYDTVPLGENSWIDEVRLQLGNQIHGRAAEGKPIVIEAGFGTNADPRGENPFSHTISDLFDRLEETGIGPTKVKWIVIQASYEKRAGRNRKRKDTVPEAEFDRFAADGGDLSPDQQAKWEALGTALIRVPNEHDDIDKFRADIISAFRELYKDGTREKKF
jgi:hypothetical protein